MAYHQFVVDLHVSRCVLFCFRVNWVLLVLIVFISLLYGLVRIPTLLIYSTFDLFDWVMPIEVHRWFPWMEGALFDVFFVYSVDNVFVSVRTFLVWLLDLFLDWRSAHHRLLKNTNILSTLWIFFFLDLLVRWWCHKIYLNFILFIVWVFLAASVCFRAACRDLIIIFFQARQVWYIGFWNTLLLLFYWIKMCLFIITFLELINDTPFFIGPWFVSFKTQKQIRTSFLIEFVRNLNTLTFLWKRLFLIWSKAFNLFLFILDPSWLRMFSRKDCSLILILFYIRTQWPFLEAILANRSAFLLIINHKFIVLDLIIFILRDNRCEMNIYILFTFSSIYLFGTLV